MQAPTPLILLVEDDDSLSAMYSLGLATEGFKVMTAPSCGRAWEALRKFVPDAVVLDHILPGGTGLELCRRIRAAPALRDLHVVILTSDKRVTEGSSWFDAGADSCWKKPTRAGRLAALLKGLLRRKAPFQGREVPLNASARLDRILRQVLIGGSVSKVLTRLEMAFIEALARQGTISRREAIDCLAVRGDPDSANLTLTTRVHRLRQKLPEGGAGVFVTLPREGFRLVREENP